jgi:hypothetical protein
MGGGATEGGPGREAAGQTAPAEAGQQPTAAPAQLAPQQQPGHAGPCSDPVATLAAADEALSGLIGPSCDWEWPLADARLAGGGFLEGHGELLGGGTASIEPPQQAYIPPLGLLL